MIGRATPESDEPSIWKQIRAIFSQAVDLPPEQREAFIADACRHDLHVQMEVDSLVRAHDRAGAFLEVAGVDVVAPWLDASSDPERSPLDDDREDGGPRGSEFGPYRVLKELGRGGMGTVYLAERADERYERRVAIKIVSGGVAGAFARRFGREQRILASLEHPAIAQLYDAGTTSEGVPYLVMEFVEGRRIDDYCRDERLPVTERLELFDRVCAAVEFAHTRMVVHRDLKPSNVLVTREGVPKLLDFGVAGLLDPVDEVVTDPTTFGFRALTPEYASPEQLRGEPVSTSSDVWALGVLLYGLLTGRHPYRFESRSPIEIERVVRENPPERPSDAVIEEGGDGAQSVARRLKGDLDNVVLTALRVEPARRYETVGRLRADVRAHLEGFPVTARPDTWRYRAAKFARRHRVAVAAGSIVSLSLFGGLAGVAVQGRVAAREAQRAEATRDYLIGMFESLDPDALRGRSLTVEELLDLGAEALDRELEGQPEVRAEVAGVLGGVFQRLGAYARARPLLESARQSLLDRHGANHPATVVATTRLASLLHEQGELVEAEELATQSLEARRRLYGTGDTAVATGLSDLGMIRSSRGEFEDALALMDQALAIDQASGRRDAVATDLNNLAIIRLRLAENEEALRLGEEALAIQRELYGDLDTRVATSLRHVADALMALGRYGEAIAAFEECLMIRRELLGDRHPDVAVALDLLGRAHQSKGDLDAAETALLEALSIRREVFGEQHTETAITVNNLAIVAYFRGDYELAADRFRGVVDTWRVTLGEEHPDVLSGLNNLGASLRAAGELAAAEEVLREVLEMRERVLPAGHSAIWGSHNVLADVLRARGRYAEAEREYRIAIDGWREALGEDHSTVAFGYLGLGILQRDTGRC